jgi:hypothetical protein
MAADLWGDLGQVSPAASTLTTLYTVPAARRASITVLICNRGTAATTVRVALSPSGAAIANAQYMLYDFALAANAAQSTFNFVAKATDVIRVLAASADVSFHANGIEEDA